MAAYEMAKIPKSNQFRNTVGVTSQINKCANTDLPEVGSGAEEE
jgi:hypothetical protein